MKAEVRSEHKGILENLKRDLGYFVDEFNDPAIRIKCTFAKPQLSGLPNYRAKYYKRDSIAFGSGDKRIVDYRGRAVTIYNYKSEVGEVISDDEAKLHEVTYLLLLSRVGEHLDDLGLHRVHGFGIRFNDHGVLGLIPEGGGKTTTLMSLLDDQRVRIFSDDTPVISGGKMLPFPSRMSLCLNDAPVVPDEFKRRFMRTERDEKVLIDLTYFKGRIGEPVSLDTIILGERTLSPTPNIRRVSRLRAVKPLMRDMVFGLGIPQLLEHFLRQTTGDYLHKTVIFMRRSMSAARILLQSRVYACDFGTDRAANKKAIISVLDGLDDGLSD